jgi:23S rRNA pseudouridine2605 synthase
VLDKQNRANAWLTVSLEEGRNREIRKVMEHMGLEVNRLIRLAYGPFQLGNLKRGQTSEVTGKVLREQLGEQEAGTVSGPGGVPQNPRGRTGTKKQEAKK